MIQAERWLQREILLRLRALPIVAIPIPNGIWIPTHNPAERVLVARVVARMKSDGMLTPGAPDLVLLWAGGAACVEIKRPMSVDLYGKRPRGRPNDAQCEFGALCATAGVRYVIVESWEELQCHLTEWGVSPASG